MRKFLLILFLFSLTNTYADDINKLIKKANQLFDNESYFLAQPILEKIHKTQPETDIITLKLGIAYYWNADKFSAKNILLELEKSESKVDKKELLYYLARTHHFLGEYTSALKYYTTLLKMLNDQYAIDEIERYIDMCKNAEVFYGNSTKAIINNLGDSINSIYPDYSSVINAKRTLMMFTSKRPNNTGAEKDIFGKEYEDIFMSSFRNDKWSKAKRLNTNINTPYHESSLALSADGQKLYIYKSDERGGNIFKSNLNGDVWEIPTVLGSHINSKNAQEASITISPDGNTIYFVSNRPGGYGGKDIYKTTRIKDDYWSMPVNLGAKINTIYDEDGPFIQADGKTLYFCSKGHSSIGGYDIFKSVLREDKFWTVPENLGFPVNSPADDIFLEVDAAGKVGFFSSNRVGGKGDFDIYELIIPEKKVPLTILSGTIKDYKTQKPINAKLKVYDKMENKWVKYVVSPNSKTGKYLVIFPPGRNYDIHIDAAGYDKFIVNSYVPNQDYFHEIYQEIYLKKVLQNDSQVNSGIVVKNVFNDLTTKEEEKEHGEFNKLFNILNDIIVNIDTLELENLDDVMADNTQKLPKMDDSTKKEMDAFNALRSLINSAIETTDSTTLNNIEIIANTSPKEHFFTKNNKSTNDLYYVSPNEEIKVVDLTKLYPDSTINIDTDSTQIQQNNHLDTSITKTAHKELKPNIAIQKKYNLYYYTAIYTLTNSQKTILDKIYANYLKGMFSSINIIGFTDQTGSLLDNIVLSKKRANNVASYLIKKGINKDNLNTQGKGEDISTIDKTNKLLMAKRRTVLITLIK